MKSFKYGLIWLCILTIMFACQDDEDTPSLPDLNMYLEHFEEEARVRGYDFDLSSIEVEYLEKILVNDSNTACGRTIRNYPVEGITTIQISKEARCNWAGRKDIERENLFFHEIGHAFFRRQHEETLLCDGSPVTIMTSKDGFTMYKEGESEKRDYYINELIDRLTAQDQCIAYDQDWVVDPVYYAYSQEDEGWYFDSDQENYEGTRGKNNDQDFLSVAAKPGSNAENTGYWYRQFFYPNLPECADIRFKVRMNAEQLDGPGAAIAVRAYENINSKYGATTEEYLFLTTEDQPISGSLYNHEAELLIPCFSRRAAIIIIFVGILPGTAGEVKFDDIQMIVENS